MFINDLVIPSFDTKHVYLVSEITEKVFTFPCDIRIRRIDKKDTFENNIFTCSSCLQKYDQNEKLGINLQLKLF